MGQIYTAFVKNGESLYWNPAGLGYADATELSLTHMFYLQETNYDFVSYCEPMGDLGTIAVGGSALYSGAINRTLEDSSGNYVATGSSFDTLESAIMIGWGKQIDKKAAVGATVKTINQRIASESAAGVAGDIGMQCKVSETIKSGITVQNIGPQIEGNDLPTMVKVGGSLQIPSRLLLLGLDIDYPFAGKPAFGIGLERGIGDLFAARIGYNSGAETGGLTGIHAGIGLKWNLIEFDYAFVPYGDIGNTHRLSLGLKFK
jgi:hypothetical protein